MTSAQADELLAGIGVMAAGIGVMVDGLAAILAELKGQRRGLRRSEDAARAELVVALRDFFGQSPFTSGGVLLAADESPDLADAVAAVINMNADLQSRKVQLGILLGKLPDLELCGQHRGAGLYRVGP